MMQMQMASVMLVTTIQQLIMFRIPKAVLRLNPLKRVELFFLMEPF